MDALLLWQLLADAVLTLHFAVVLFVVGGALAILMSARLAWPWLAAWWFRLAHLGAIAWVVLQAWLGMHCPLTVLEGWLRTQARGVGYEKSFIEHWVQRLLYYEAPPWVFGLVYSLFGLLVLWLWWRFPPGPRHRIKRGGPQAGR